MSDEDKLWITWHVVSPILAALGAIFGFLITARFFDLLTESRKK